jgi:neurotransmitter:Na+ symporter, NSS family
MRASFGSNLGFLLSAAGSAIGLGNIWKFPYITGVNGGGIFVLFYMACVFLIALPVLMAEIAIGQQSQSNAIKSFDVIEKKTSLFKSAGILGVLASMLIIAFYGVVGGWIVYYLFESLVAFTDFSTTESIERVFNSAFSDVQISLTCQAIFMILVVVVVAKGVKKGIEKINMLAIPFLVLILLSLLYTVYALPGFDQAIKFLFSPNTQAFTFKGALEAIGHSFFTVSVGVGIMITYGSYLPKNTKIGSICLVIVLVDTLVALISGIVIFSILFSFDSSPSQGPILIFKTLPVLFAKMNNGMIISSAFFLLVLLTALTSAISLLEVPVAYLVDRGLSRKKSLIWVCIITVILSIPCGLSFNILADFKIFDLTIFGLFDSVSSKFLLPISGLICVLFFGFKMNNQEILKFNFKNSFMRNIFVCTTKIFAPASILIIMLGEIFG